MDPQTQQVRIEAHKDVSGPQSSTLRYWSVYVYDVQTGDLAWDHSFDRGFASKREALEVGERMAHFAGRKVVA